jgi:hypothetical protein
MTSGVCAPLKLHAFKARVGRARPLSVIFNLLKGEKYGNQQ